MVTDAFEEIQSCSIAELVVTDETVKLTGSILFVAFSKVGSNRYGKGIVRVLKQAGSASRPRLIVVNQ